MKATVYVETSVVSYLTASPSRDPISTGHQQITKNWWESAQEMYELFSSEVVEREAGAGDPRMAEQRLRIITTLTMVQTTEEARSLASQLIESGAVPRKAEQDALHIAITATNGIEYLLTWNCKHLANATMRSRIEEICRTAGYEPPIICTPEELTEPD